MGGLGLRTFTLVSEVGYVASYASNRDKLMHTLGTTSECERMGWKRLKQLQQPLNNIVFIAQPNTRDFGRFPTCCPRTSMQMRAIGQEQC